jgi:hypothetical protein
MMDSDNDPTYDQKEIDADPIMRLAFQLSEQFNDHAPVGWSRFLPVAHRCLAEARHVRLLIEADQSSQITH